MAELKLRTVNFNIQRDFPEYVISSVIDCDWGYRGVRLIQTPEELDRYYEGSEDRDGYINLLDGGSSLLLTRLSRVNTKSPTLRIFNSEYSYCAPNIYDSREFIVRPPEELIDLTPTFHSNTEELIKDVNLNETLTYSIVLDFSDTVMTDEDYIAIPKYFPTVPSFDNSVIFYFTDLNPTNLVDRKFPNDFNPPVELGTLGSESLGIDINNVDGKDRAKIIYEWYLGTLAPDTSKYSMIGTPGDSNFIPEQSILDEENNTVTLVFKRPVRNIRYYKSNSNNPFTVRPERYLNQRLIEEANNSNAVVSFNSKIEGDTFMNLTLEYVKAFEYNMTLEFGDVVETYYVSIDRNARLNQGVSIFIDDVLSSESDLIESSVHLGSKIESGEFTEQDAENIEGSYKISYGRLGSAVPVGGELTPFQRSIDKLTESELLSNLFVFTTEYEVEDQVYALEKYLSPNVIVGLVTIPEFYTTEEDIKKYLLSDSLREIMLYIYGRSTLQGRASRIRNSYWYALNSINGDFKATLPNSVFPMEVDDSVKSILEKYKINIPTSSIDNHFIDYIENIETFIEPHYLLSANYVKTYLTRFLKNELGRYPNDLRKRLDQELSKLTSYSNLITAINLTTYIATNNNLTVVVQLDLSGLVGRSIDVKININRQNI